MDEKRRVRISKFMSLVLRHEPEKANLTLPPRQLCLSCHDQLKERIQKAGLVHAPVREGKCASCHNGHSSDQPKLLNAAVPTL